MFSDGVLGIGLAMVSLVVFMGYLLHGEDEQAASGFESVPLRTPV